MATARTMRTTRAAKKPTSILSIQINLDGNEREIEKGKYLVGTLKKLVRVPDDYELDLVINGEFKPLADDAEIKIKGGEVLVSHVRRGGSS